MNIKATLEKKISAKTGKEYLVVVLQLCNGYEKLVFLEKAEIKLLELSNK